MHEWASYSVKLHSPKLRGCALAISQHFVVPFAVVSSCDGDTSPTTPLSTWIEHERETPRDKLLVYIQVKSKRTLMPHFAQDSPQGANQGSAEQRIKARNAAVVCAGTRDPRSESTNGRPLITMMHDIVIPQCGMASLVLGQSLDRA